MKSACYVWHSIYACSLYCLHSGGYGTYALSSTISIITSSAFSPIWTWQRCVNVHEARYPALLVLSLILLNSTRVKRKVGPLRENLGHSYCLLNLMVNHHWWWRMLHMQCCTYLWRQCDCTQSEQALCKWSHITNWIVVMWIFRV